MGPEEITYTLGASEVASRARAPAAPAGRERDGAPRLEAAGLGCRRNGRLLFSGLSFTLGPGEAVQIDGPNGAGKTTLLRILCGLAAPDAGELRWCGVDIGSVRPEFLSRVAYVGHAHGIKEELTPRENLRFARALGPPADAACSSDEALERVGLAELASAPARALSAGQRRRVALARLLVTPARLWVLDELFTGLDKRATGLAEEMLTAHTEGGGLLVLTSHRPTRIGCSRLMRVHLPTRP